MGCPGESPDILSWGADPWLPYASRDHHGGSTPALVGPPGCCNNALGRARDDRSFLLGAFRIGVGARRKLSLTAGPKPADKD
jgi:hypothetical protein